MSDSNQQRQGPGRSEKTKYLVDKIERSIKDSYAGQRWWSLATHGSTILIVTFSSTSAVLAKWGPDPLIGNIANTTLATSLSLLVAIISTVQSRLGFERKWIANRMTRSALSQLEIDEKMGKDPCY